MLLINQRGIRRIVCCSACMFTDVGTCAAVDKRGGQVLQGGVFVRVNAQVTQAHLCQRSRHAGSTLQVHGLQVFVNPSRQLVGTHSGCGGKAQSCSAPGGNPYLHTQAGHRV